MAESAAYNLREALDAVVGGQPTPAGGVIEHLREAWRRYQVAVRGSGTDVEAARAELDGALARLDQEDERQTFRTRKLLEYIRDQTGIEPLPGESDPLVRYSRLLGRANHTLHEEGTVSGVSALYDEVAAWFVRFFTPPDARVRALVELVEQPYAEGLVDELRVLVVDSHHLRLFLSRFRDVAWLDPLYDAGLIQLPRDGELWPVMVLVDGTGAIDPAHVAALLDRLLGDSRRGPESLRLGIAREIILCASRLGDAGHAVAKKVISGSSQLRV